MKPSRLMSAVALTLALLSFDASRADLAGADRRGRSCRSLRAPSPTSSLASSSSSSRRNSARTSSSRTAPAAGRPRLPALSPRPIPTATPPDQLGRAYDRAGAISEPELQPGHRLFGRRFARCRAERAGRFAGRAGSRRSPTLSLPRRRSRALMNFGSAGVGTATHLSAMRFMSSAGMQAVHVPFKGGPEAMNEIIAGRLDFFFAPVGNALPFVKDGMLTALVVNSAKRSAVLPDGAHNRRGRSQRMLSIHSGSACSCPPKHLAPSSIGCTAKWQRPWLRRV